MVSLTILTTLLSLGAISLAHTKQDEVLVVPNLSLPDLSSLDYVDSLSITDWDIIGDGIFLDGRIILTPDVDTKSTLLNRNRFPNSDKWTFELIFRSLNNKGKTGSGLSLQLLNSDYKIDEGGDFLYGGIFDGLNFVVDAESFKANSIHAYLNDGNNDLKNKERVHEEAFASCLLNYQDSQVPNTLRIAYSKGEYLMAQIDNKVCFKTTKVDLSDINSFKIKLNAVTNSIHEQFEILKLKVYSGIITEISENFDKFADQPRIVKQVVDSETKKPIAAAQLPEQQKIKTSSVKSEDIQVLLSKIEEVTHSNLQLHSKISSLESKLAAYQSTLQSTLNDQIEALKNYNPPAVRAPAVGKDHGKELSKQLDSLVAQFNSKLDAWKAQAGSNSNIDHEGFKTVGSELKSWLMYVLIALILLCGVLAYSLMYLRNELKRKIL